MWGEYIQKCCIGSEPSQLKLRASVYTIKMSDPCVYEEEGCKTLEKIKREVECFNIENNKCT